jgi:UDPglucose 6-dehydrogenase
MDIAIIGTGYVGLTTGACFASLGNRVWCYDIDPKKVETLRAGKIPIYEPGLETLVKDESTKGRLFFTHALPDAINNQGTDRNIEAAFICVPTPTSEDGSANLTYLENSVRDIVAAADHPLTLVEKSTSPVQTAKGLEQFAGPHGIVVNPEFLREGSAIADFLNPDRIVVGYKAERDRTVMERLYEPFKRRNVPIYWTDPNSAELIKHVSNAALAQKISFINLVAQLCSRTGADVQKVADAVGADKRIGRPFLDAGLGYGGSCFPKDLAALRHVLRTSGIQDDMLRAVHDVNESMPGYYVGLVEGALGSLEGKTLGIWGLAFKPNTDDMREARAVPIIRMLHERGASLKAYDPQAMRNAKAILEDPALPAERQVKLTYCAGPFDAIQDAEAMLLLTEWDEFKNADLKRLRQLTPRVIDGRNLYSPKLMKELGFTYRSIGRA